jgi:hypothetical protein
METQNNRKNLRDREKLVDYENPRSFCVYCLATDAEGLLLNFGLNYECKHCGAKYSFWDYHEELNSSGERK